MPLTNPDYSQLNHEEMAKAIGLKVKHIPMLVGSFLEESSPILERLQTAIEVNNYSEIQSSAHSIKGSAGNLRFSELSEMAKEIEHAAANADASFEYATYFDAIKKAISTISV
jgi:HPt (histidine-containing phosphotransfer) domain-containing protein